MNLSDIQLLYDKICKREGKLSVKAYFVEGVEIDFIGLYVEIPFRKIYLNTNKFTVRTIYHELFHHLNPSLHDGEDFENKLNEFINKETLILN